METTDNDRAGDTVLIGPNQLEGFLGIPENARGLVIFAHGAGSSRFSTRNNLVAATLRSKGLATLLFDLLSEREAADRRNVFDVALLSERLIEAMHWVRAQGTIRHLPIGLFGSSTGAAAALAAAARMPGQVSAVVSRGGRPDLAGPALGAVRCPTLLIVGGADLQVLQLNEEALEAMSCEKRLTIVPGATHLFEEKGALESVAEDAAVFFSDHLGPPEGRR